MSTEPTGRRNRQYDVANTEIIVETADTVTLVMTGSEPEVVRQQATLAGVDEILRKPPDLAALEAYVAAGAGMPVTLQPVVGDRPLRVSG